VGRSESKNTRATKKKNIKNKKIFTVMLGLVVIGAVCLSAYTLATKKVVEKWEDKVYPGITIDNIDVGSM